MIIAEKCGFSSSYMDFIILKRFSIYEINLLVSRKNWFQITNYSLVMIFAAISILTVSQKVRINFNGNMRFYS